MLREGARCEVLRDILGRANIDVTQNIFARAQKKGPPTKVTRSFLGAQLCRTTCPAAKAAGVLIPDGHRWGLHNLRHSLSNWLVNKAKENPKTVQGILGHSRIQTTLDLYTDEDLDEMIAAQDKFLDAVGFERETVQ